MRGHPRKKEGGEFFSTWSFSDTPQTAIFNLWRLHMGLADLLLARCWEVSDSLSLTPFWGLRYGEIRHKLKQDADVSMKNKFWGVGPEMGFEGMWNLCNWLGIYGKSGLSLLYGKFYVHQDIEEVNFLEEYFQMSGVLEMALGFRLGRGCFFGDLAFEIFLFPGQNQLSRFLSNTKSADFAGNQGDLSLYGFSFGLGAYF